MSFQIMFAFSCRVSRRRLTIMRVLLRRNTWEVSSTLNWPTIMSLVTNKQCIPVLLTAILMGTFQNKNAHLFWSVSRNLQLQENPIVCWKFCHVLHKLLREGYRKVFVFKIDWHFISTNYLICRQFPIPIPSVQC